VTFEQWMTATTVIGLQVANFIKSWHNGSQNASNHAAVMEELGAPAPTPPKR
jgi:hypothetical protein